MYSTGAKAHVSREHVMVERDRCQRAAAGRAAGPFRVFHDTRRERPAGGFFECRILFDNVFVCVFQALVRAHLGAYAQGSHFCRRCLTVCLKAEMDCDGSGNVKLMHVCVSYITNANQVRQMGC